MSDSVTTSADAQALESLDRKLALVRDRVRAVGTGHHYGLFLHGAAGLGKSFSVHAELDELNDELGIAVHNFNGRLTAKALFLAMKATPDAIFVLEDLERVTNDVDAQSVLRSALWQHPGGSRFVMWTTAAETLRIEFTGGVIMVANRGLANLPELRAVASRIPVMELELTFAEIAAQMRRIAGKGFRRGDRHLDAGKTVEVCEYVIAECERSGCTPDLRFLEIACIDFVAWSQDRTSCHWHDLVSNHVRQSVRRFSEPVRPIKTREAEAQADRQTLVEILAEADERDEQFKLWKERTGKGQSVFYKRLAEVNGPKRREFNL